MRTKQFFSPPDNSLSIAVSKGTVSQAPVWAGEDCAAGLGSVKISGQKPVSSRIKARNPGFETRLTIALHRIERRAAYRAPMITS